MRKNFINALDAAKEYNLYLKVVTSIKSFDTYNSFLTYLINMMMLVDD